MKRETPRRDQWRRTDSGTWTRSLGNRGARVRLFQKRQDGPYYREVYIKGAGRDQACLGTTDQKEALRLGQELLAALITHSFTGPRSDGPVRLGELVERYQRECPMYLDNKQHSRESAATHAAVLLGYFGPDLDVRTLTVNDTTLYSQKRKKGGITYTRLTMKGEERRRVTGAVRQRVVHADLSLLRTMIRWACTVRTADGGRWLPLNPLEGIRFDREKNPRRTVATYDQYEATQAALARLAERAPSDGERLKWERLGFALWLAEAFGRRRGSIAALDWGDFDLTKREITWRAESDKKEKEWKSPLSEAHAERIQDFRRRLGGFRGPVFPQAGDLAQRIPADMLSQWLLEAEAEGKVQKLKGSLWHAYRRKWASERMHHPLKAVAEAGGWKDAATLLIYQHADEETVLAVLNEPKKRRARVASRGLLPPTE